MATVSSHLFPSLHDKRDPHDPVVYIARSIASRFMTPRVIGAATSCLPQARWVDEMRRHGDLGTSSPAHAGSR